MPKQVLDLFLISSAEVGGLATSVVVIAKRGPDIALGLIPIDATLEAIARFTDRIEAAVTGRGTRPTAVELDALGTTLFDLVFRDRLLDLYNRAAGSPIALQIVTDQQVVHRIAWEYLRSPDRVPVPHPDRCPVRVLPMCAPGEPSPARNKARLRVLLVVADPVDQAGVGWAQVEASVRRAMESQLDGIATLKVIPGATAKELVRALNAERYDVLHFLGHGTLVDGEGHLNLVDADTRASELISAKNFAVALAGRGLQLCILSACLTGAGRYDDDFGAVATSLLRAGIPAVIANQASIPTKSVGSCHVCLRKRKSTRVSGSAWAKSCCRASSLVFGNGQGGCGRLRNGVYHRCWNELRKVRLQGNSHGRQDLEAMQ